LHGEACSLQDERERGEKACAVATAEEQSSREDEQRQQREGELEREHKAHKVYRREGLHCHTSREGRCVTVGTISEILHFHTGRRRRCTISEILQFHGARCVRV